MQRSAYYAQYLVFDSQNYFNDADAAKAWKSGNLCTNKDVRPNMSSPLGTFHCPMPFETEDYTYCCGEALQQYCCRPIENPYFKWAIIIGGIMAAIALLTSGYFLYSRWLSCCYRKENNQSVTRSKFKLYSARHAHIVHPLDRRTLLKTGNYTVDQSMDTVTIHFQNKEFFRKFLDVFYGKKPEVLLLSENKNIRQVMVKSISGAPAQLQIVNNTQKIHVTKPGNTSWVMNDFQIVCKDVSVSEQSEKADSSTTRHKLTPRLPTTGEHIYDTDDYHVKTTQTEIEVRFSSDVQFQSFKKSMNDRYADLIWTKYLQRDCTQIKSKDNRTVTVHVWDEIRTLWISGDGKRSWFAEDFYEVFSDATAIPRKAILAARSRSISSASSGGFYSAVTSPENNRWLRRRDYPEDYSATDIDDYKEIEFESQSYITYFRELIGRKYPASKWESFPGREVIQVFTDDSKLVTVHISSPLLRKLWLYEAGRQGWFSVEFKQLYCTAYEIVNHITDLPPDLNADRSSITPVDTRV